MKKLMVTLAAVAVAAGVQAASVSWESGDFTDLPACGQGGIDDCVRAYVWESATQVYTDAASVWAAYQAGDLDIKDAYTEDSFFGTAEVKGGSGWTEGDAVYAAILYLHSDDYAFDKPDYYMANTASAIASNAGAIKGKLGNLVGGTGGSTPTEWAAVPEPTSGLLLLLGVAGLALRRRRA